MERLYVGTYTQGTESKGIYVFDFNTGTGALSLCGTQDKTPNPSFLAVGEGFLYAASEDWNRARVDAYRLDAQTGIPVWINSVSASGGATCHVSLHPRKPLLFAANYATGSVLCIPIREDGGLSESYELRQHTGSGPNQVRQEGPHAHSVTPCPSGEYVLAADLGADKLFAYAQTENSGLTKADWEVAVPAGEGPRHFVYTKDAKRGYLVTELGNKVIYYQCDARGILQQRQAVSLLPPDFEGESIAADVHLSPDERYVYASSRGWDGICGFAAARDGTLASPQYFNWGGVGPRSFCISPDGRWLAVANQDSNSVDLFARDCDSGILTRKTCSVPVPQAVCVKWHETEKRRQDGK